jgi:hypothetical protein
MHAPERISVAVVDLRLEMGFCGEETRAVVATDAEGVGESGAGDEAVVDAPWFEETGCVGG